MKKRLNGEQTATVGINGSERRIIEKEQEGKSFDYDVFSRDVVNISKRRLDACLLVPVKFYNDNKNIAENVDFVQLDAWMEKFSSNPKNYCCIWLYITYENGGDAFERWCRGNESDSIKGVNVIESAKGHLGDAAKLKDSKYISDMCKNRDTTEAWILNAYEVTFKRIFNVSQMALLVQKIIVYLNDCGINIQRPMATQQNERVIYQITANLMLLVTRIRLGISVSEAVEWYKSGNVAYSLYEDQMLNEYVCVLGECYYNSYERFVRMQALALENKNKYAAKEIGDIYSLGCELQDIYGNRISVMQSKEMACDFYRISVEYEYTPAYIPAIKTKCLIEPVQKERLYQMALEVREPQALVECAKEHIVDADRCVQRDVNKACVLVENAVNCMLLLKDDCGEKYVIRNMLIFSNCFAVAREGSVESLQMAKHLQNAFSCDIFSLKEEALSKEIENNYLLASQFGYFEAEYKLAKHYEDKNEAKSKQYIMRGKDKGCKYCMLEYIVHQKEQKPDDWFDTMLYLGKTFYDDTNLLIMIAKEWTRNESFFEDVVADGALINSNKLIELYLQINNIIYEIDKRQEASSEKVEIQGQLFGILNKLKVIIKERVS